MLQNNTEEKRKTDEETQRLKRIHGRIATIEHPQARRAVSELKQVIEQREKR